MSNDKLAFFIGLLGSLHCIGMCGPLAFAIPMNQPGVGYLLLNKFTYQLGRIISYCMLGAIVGLLGQQVWQAGFQRGVSLLTGALVLLAGLSRLMEWRITQKTPSVFLKPFHRLFNYAFHHKANHLIIGMINGVLPCGFVYLALAGAIGTGNLIDSVSYLFWFGAGTTPLMFAATVTAGLAGMKFRKSLNKLMPFMMLLIGLWFIFRGLELDIPFLSPQPVGLALECK